MKDKTLPEINNPKRVQSRPRKYSPLSVNINNTIKALLLVAWTGLSFIVAQYLIGYPLLWIFGSEAFNSVPMTTLFTLLSYLLAIFLAIFVPRSLKLIKKPTREELGLRGLPTWTDIGLSIVGIIVSLILAALLTALFSNFPWFDADAAQENAFGSYLSGPNLLLAFISLVVVAPIAEEILFRGFLYGKLRKTYTLFFSLILVSLTFAIMHLQWNVGVTVFALSVVLCLLREMTGTIYAGILVHMLKNGLAFFLLYIIGTI